MTHADLVTSTLDMVITKILISFMRIIGLTNTMAQEVFSMDVDTLHPNVEESL